METPREGGLVRWQWTLYPDGHRDRRNLIIHAATVPLFILGSSSVAIAPILNGWMAAFGAGAMLVAVAAQGRGHKMEQTAPVPFRSPFDAAARLFVEQWINFPRFVLSGAFVRSWREGWGRGGPSR